jgi:hypothetical protein
MVNTNYHKSINKVLISKNYFDALQEKLLLGDNRPEHTGFAIGILRVFWKKYDKYMEHSTGYQQSYPQYNFCYAKSYMAIGAWCEPMDCDRYDYHNVTPYVYDGFRR